MYGVYLVKMGEYVISAHGEEVWNKARADAGHSFKVYLPGEPYPDEELDLLVASVCMEASVSPEELWENIGLSAGSSVIAAYKSLINPEWKTLEVLEYLQSVIEMIRSSKGDFPHPFFNSDRISKDKLMLVYASPRKLCALAKGMVKGVAMHYGEKVSIEETACMCTGAPECRIVITREA